MLKRAITYTDFDGNEVTEEFYFNLSKAELIEMDLRSADGLVKHLSSIVENQDKDKLVTEFKALLLKCYGEKSEDGKRFIKNDRIREDFESHAAFDQLFLDLVTSEQAVKAFILGVLPTDMAKAATEGVQQDKPTELPRVAPRPPKTS